MPTLEEIEAPHKTIEAYGKVTDRLLTELKLARLILSAYKGEYVSFNERMWAMETLMADPDLARMYNLDPGQRPFTLISPVRRRSAVGTPPNPSPQETASPCCDQEHDVIPPWVFTHEEQRLVEGVYGSLNLVDEYRGSLEVEDVARVYRRKCWGRLSKSTA